MNQNLKILYIDDEKINVELFEIIFSEKFNVFTGYCGEDGLSILENNPDIDVIISDMKMPGMSGIEFIDRAKKKFNTKRYFLLTGYGINQEIKSALDKGLIHKCFTKPMNKIEIENIISNNL